MRSPGFFPSVASWWNDLAGLASVVERLADGKDEDGCPVSGTSEKTVEQATGKGWAGGRSWLGTGDAARRGLVSSQAGFKAVEIEDQTIQTARLESFKG